MMMGYCFGKVFTITEGHKRKKVLLMSGAAIILFFIILRAWNVYGNPEHWSTQKNTFYTFLSFINTHKYPPSLLYMCMTIGPALLFLAWAGNKKNRLTRIITVYGRVPFFYYVLHFFLIHIIATMFYMARGHSLAEPRHTDSLLVPNFVVPGEGVPLWAVYLLWLMIVAMLYPVCKWFSEYKQTHKAWWLSYL
jgi:uncharacterized membrane protein